MKILTFDIEDWFHILDNSSTKTEMEWMNFETRIHHSVDCILEILAESKLTATFFCLGWIAKKYPNVIKKIDSHGHEIGSHSHMHQLVFEQNPDEFRVDLKLSLDVLESTLGKKIKIYRAPGFSIKKNCLWAFEILAENGIEIDCSIFPAIRAHGGIVDLPIKTPSLIERNGILLKEFPITVFGLGQLKMPYAGGGYFRLLPYSLIKAITTKSDYVMTYFHPRDFDSDQPLLKDLSIFRKFKSYYGLSRSLSKFTQFISDFEFISLNQAAQKMNWDNSKKIVLN